MANCKSKYGGKDYKNLFGKEIDEKMMKVLSITKRLAKAPQEYQKFITDIRSSQEKFPLKDAPKIGQVSDTDSGQPSCVSFTNV